MATKGMDRVIYSVGNMGRALDFYRDMIGMTQLGERQLDSFEVTRFWKLPATIEARAVLLKSELQDTTVELIEFLPNSGVTVRSGPEDFSWGIYDIAWFVKDIQHCFEQGLAKGYRFLSPPIQYQPNWVPWQVKETVMLGPDNAALVLFERLTDEARQYRRQYIRMNHSAFIVGNLEEGKKFFCEFIGMDVRGEMEIPSGIVDRVLNIPPGTKCRGAFLEKRGTNTCIIELLEMAMPGRPLGAKARPPNLGIIGYAFEVENFEELLRLLPDAGYEIYAGPLELRKSFREWKESAIVSGPYGALVEIFRSR